jgi:hypothetical protein
MDKQLNKQEARTIVNRMAEVLENAEQSYRELGVTAYNGRAWIALGYKTWEAMCEAEFPRRKLTVEQRREEIEYFRAAGLSTRGIAAATGVDPKTVRNDLNSGGENSPPEKKPTPVKGQDGKQYAAKRTPRARVVPEAKPSKPVANVKQPTKRQETNADVMKAARKAAALRAEHPEYTLAEQAQELGETEREVRRLVPLGEMPEELQHLTENVGITMRVAEVLSTNKGIDGATKVKLARKIMAGLVDASRENLPKVLDTISLWPGDIRDQFFDSGTMTFVEAENLRASEDAALRARKRRASEARKLANAMPRHAFGPHAMEQLTKLHMSLINLTQNFGLVTPDFRDALLDLLEDIIIQTREALTAGGRVRAPAQPAHQKPDLRVIDGEVG